MIFENVKQLFSKAEMHVFENPLTFEGVQPFIEYTKASLSEDRKLWTSLFNGPKEFDDLMSTIEKTAEKRLQAGWQARDDEGRWRNFSHQVKTKLE